MFFFSVYVLCGIFRGLIRGRSSSVLTSQLGAKDVISEDGVAWRVLRRYNDFWQLKEQLGDSSRRLPGAPFPRTFLRGKGVGCSCEWIGDFAFSCKYG